MAVASVEIAWITLPLPVPRGLSGGPIRESTDAVCRVTTDDGVEGIGEARGWDLPIICEIADQALRPVVLSSDETDVEAVWQRMHGAVLGPEVLRPAHWKARAVLAAIGMMDQALWDVRAKRAGVPICELLGGSRRPIPAYLSAGFYVDGQTLDEMTEEAAASLERCGYRALKIRVGRGIIDSAERLRSVRRNLGDDLILMADANQRWELTTAVRAVKRFEAFDLTWLEEVIKPHGGVYYIHGGHDANGDTGRLSHATTIPLAVGENHISLQECRDVVLRGNVAYMQFDAIKSGGVTEWMRVARFCERQNVPVAPHHVPHFHVQLAAAVPHGRWVECFDYDKQHPTWPDLFPGFPPVVDGAITPPDAPGWGMTINEEMLRKHGTLVRWRN